MMGVGITGSCLSDCLDVPDNHLLAQQQAGLDNETLQLVQMLVALSEQTHYLRARRDTPHVWPDDGSSSEEEPAPEVQHVLCPPSNTDMLSRDGDDMWLAGLLETRGLRSCAKWLLLT